MLCAVTASSVHSVGVRMASGESFHSELGKTCERMHCDSGTWNNALLLQLT